jgi:hypothetical protein
MIDGRERPTIDHVARLIREAGYITTDKRGAGAAEMTAREAANLVIALNGADTPKEAPVAIDRFRSLKQWAIVGRGAPGSKQLEQYDNYPQTIKDVMDVHTFGEAMDSLIENVPDLVACLRQYAHDAYNNIDRSLRLNLYGLSITFLRYAAKIELYTMYGSDRRVQFEGNFMEDPDRPPGFYGNAWPDRRISVTIGVPTLIAAWQVLNPGETLPGIPDPTTEAKDD